MAVYTFQSEPYGIPFREASDPLREVWPMPLRQTLRARIESWNDRYTSLLMATTRGESIDQTNEFASLDAEALQLAKE